MREDALPPRFVAKIVPEPNTGCWLWTGALDLHGYGKFAFPDRRHVRFAHRLAFEMLVGPVPTGLELDHRCRMRCCVNPAHLEPVTHAENLRRGSTSENVAALHRAKTHCPAGHAYDEQNTYHHGGERLCKECRREAVRRYRARPHAPLLSR